MSVVKSLITRGETCNFPLFDGVEVTLAFVTKKDIIDLRDKCKINKYDPMSNQFVDSLDVIKFDKEFVNAVIKGWTGLKRKHLAMLNIPYTPKDDEDGELEVVYTEEEALAILGASNRFSDFVDQKLKDYSNFAEAKKEELRKKSSSSQSTPSKQAK